VTAAEREGVTPQELADRNAAKFEELMPIIDAATTSSSAPPIRATPSGLPRSCSAVYDNGWVSKGTYEGWYCPRCADFKTERELGPGQTCPIHEIPLERVREENWFFRLSAFQAQLEGPLRGAARLRRARFPPQRGGRLHQGRARGRLALAAEAEVGDAAALGPEQRMYVWFDALLNYVTALASPARART
jgi:methionyl-tRNA synthetase